ncbi:MAG: tetratricopeptide repeat protein [Lachnospiraceae bacterium]|nr:tetratricopeptide repeat protein [Lachnospiraceae bacterium]
MNRLKYITLLSLLICSTFLFTGCSNKEREEKKLTYRNAGIEHLEKGEYEKALEEFQNALSQSLGTIGEIEEDICFYKAKAQCLAGNTKEALETYGALIDYNKNSKAYFLRGNLYYTLGKEKKALEDYKSAAENEHSDYELYIAIYEVLQAKGKEKEGQEYLNSALEIEGDKAKDKMQKGRINFLLGEYQDAIDLLTVAAKGNQNDAYYYLSEIYNAIGDIPTSQEYLSKYMESEDVDSYKLYEVGKTQLSRNNHTMAISCFKMALELEEIPNKPVIMKKLVEVYESLEDFASAKAIMAQYVSEYPEDEEAQREYTFLETR